LTDLGDIGARAAHAAVTSHLTGGVMRRIRPLAGLLAVVTATAAVPLAISAPAAASADAPKIGCLVWSGRGEACFDSGANSITIRDLGADGLWVVGRWWTDYDPTVRSCLNDTGPGTVKVCRPALRNGRTIFIRLCVRPPSGGLSCLPEVMRAVI
jgi:hypothetical protein